LEQSMGKKIVVPKEKEEIKRNYFVPNFGADM
jgi:hypothetical protein